VSADVLCLRPAADFAEVGVAVPADLRVCFASSPADVPAADLGTARAVVLASVGPQLNRAWLDQVTRLQLLQFTGAGVDRAGDSCTHRPDVAVANVPAANVREVAEYVLFAAGSLLRRLAFADRQIRAGRYGAARAELSAACTRGPSG
jgi:phosphoglycerate dehydrogenase-like enzyme